MNAKHMKEARKQLLTIANCYEVKRRKQLRGVFYDARYGSYRWIGQTHDYSWFPPSE